MSYLVSVFFHVHWYPTRFPDHTIFVLLKSNTKGVTSGAGPPYSFGAPVLTLVFLSDSQLLVFCVAFYLGHIVGFNIGLLFNYASTKVFGKNKKANKSRYLIQCSGYVSGITFINYILYCSNTLYILLFNLSTLSVPDEGYSRNASCALNLISTVLLWYVHALEFKYG